ncbi:MAG: ABC transporter ATP-binding protein [Bryobacteraceae bacterium]
MLRPLEITSLTKVFETASGPYVAVRDFNLRIAPSEFVALLGHSGCGKSTVLSIVAGLQRASLGGVCIDGKEIAGPGTDRGVVFQSPALLPWLTAGENVDLAVREAFPLLGRPGRRKIVERYLDLCQIADAIDQRPAELSQGSQQRVAIARALALEPRCLLLDEPFGMLDSLTRFDLQDMLLDLLQRDSKTVILVTHDIDEALYLADRIVLMTDGPGARVGEVIEIPFPRPRDRRAVLEHPAQIELRARILRFLENHARQFRAA